MGEACPVRVDEHLAMGRTFHTAWGSHNIVKISSGVNVGRAKVVPRPMDVLRRASEAGVGARMSDWIELGRGSLIGSFEAAFGSGFGIRRENANGVGSSCSNPNKESF